MREPTPQGQAFELVTDFAPAGDQPQAIERLVQGVQQGMHGQLLLGVTGSGKTYTMANVIAQLQRPTVIMAHNKTLAAQLYGEFKAFSRTMRSNILSVITITISPKPMCHRRILLSKKTPPSTIILINCAYPPHVHCWSDAMRLLWRRCRRFMAWAIPKPI